MLSSLYAHSVDNESLGITEVENPIWLSLTVNPISRPLASDTGDCEDMIMEKKFQWLVGITHRYRMAARLDEKSGIYGSVFRLPGSGKLRPYDG
jgi:hypothetical protein